MKQWQNLLHKPGDLRIVYTEDELIRWNHKDQDHDTGICWKSMKLKNMKW